jgi:hypothetical protein
MVLHDDVAVLHAVPDDLACRADQPAVLPGHHVPDVPDDGEFGEVDGCRVDCLRDQVRDSGGAHPGDAVIEAVHLGVGRAAGLADVVVEDQNFVAGEAVVFKEVLLPGAEVGEEFQRTILRDMAHRHRLELADEDGVDSHALAGECLREDRLRADAVGVDVGDDRHRLRFADSICRSPHICFEAHLHSSAS